MGHDEHIVPLTYDHLTRIKLKKENSDFVDVIPNYIDYVWDHAAVGTSWAGIGRGKVIAAFGIRPFWDGVSEMWLIPGQEIDRHAISVIRAALLHDGEVLICQVFLVVDRLQPRR